MNNKEIGISLLLFLFVFQPPMLPFPLIYFLGPVVLCFLLIKRQRRFNRIIRKTPILNLTYFFLILTAYLLLMNIIDALVMPDKNVFSTRLRCLNQALLLTIFQFGFVACILIMTSRKKYTMEDFFFLLIKVAFIQGICALVAFLCPPIRQLFIHFGDQELFTNAYFIERRGYGFSMTLIDTFGYGMGLIAGYILLFKWRNSSRWFLIASFILTLFTIAVNARTGIFVLLIALFLRFVYHKNPWVAILKMLCLFLIGFLLFSSLSSLLELGAQSENPTISWICFSFSSILEMLSSSGTTSSSISELDFLSNFVNLPSDPLELLFGSGHYVYDTQGALGFRTDIGYLNLFWEFGIIGSAFILCAMSFFMMRPFFMTKDVSIKRIALFNTITYFLLLMKAILIGYNPGVFVNYLVSFGLYFYVNKARRDKRLIINTYIDERGTIVRYRPCIQCR